MRSRSTGISHFPPWSQTRRAQPREGWVCCRLGGTTWAPPTAAGLREARKVIVEAGSLEPPPGAGALGDENHWGRTTFETGIRPLSKQF